MNITKKDFVWTIKDDEGNFLDFIEYHNMARPSYGKVDNISITSKDHRTWQKDGRGRISESTWTKIILMNKYFYDNY